METISIKIYSSFQSSACMQFCVFKKAHVPDVENVSRDVNFYCNREKKNTLDSLVWSSHTEVSLSTHYIQHK